MCILEECLYETCFDGKLKVTFHMDFMPLILFLGTLTLNGPFSQNIYVYLRNLERIWAVIRVAPYYGYWDISHLMGVKLHSLTLTGRKLSSCSSLGS